MLNELLLRVLAWFHREEGQDMIEYALIAAVIAIPIVLVTFGLLDTAFRDWAADVASEITGAVV